jgi:hypothetical protein
LLNRYINLAAKGDPVEFIKHRPVEALDDAVECSNKRRERAYSAIITETGR